MRADWRCHHAWNSKPQIPRNRAPASSLLAARHGARLKECVMASPSSALLSGPCVYCCATQGSARLPPLAWCSHELALKRPRTSNNNPTMPRQMIAQTNAIVTRVCVSACSARFRADTAASKSVGMISGLSEWPPVTLGESPFRHFDVDQRRRLCSCGWDYEPRLASSKSKISAASCLDRLR